MDWIIASLQGYSLLEFVRDIGFPIALVLILLKWRKIESETQRKRDHDRETKLTESLEKAHKDHRKAQDDAHKAHQEALSGTIQSNTEMMGMFAQIIQRCPHNDTSANGVSDPPSTHYGKRR